MLTLEQALAELPDTADGIAAYFAEQGITGQRNHNYCCPVANYVKRTTAVEDPAVEPGLVEGFGGEGEELVCETPAAVKEFVERFDKGAWPELVVADV